jgi:3-dehydroquinate dehydratase
MREIFVTSPDTIAQLVIELHLTKGKRREKRRIRSKVALLAMESPSPTPGK